MVRYRIRPFRAEDAEVAREVFAVAMSEHAPALCLHVLRQPWALLALGSTSGLLLASARSLLLPLLAITLLLALARHLLGCAWSAYIDRCLGADLRDIGAAYAEGDGARFWVAEADGRVVGTVGVRPVGMEGTVGERMVGTEGMQPVGKVSAQPVGSVGKRVVGTVAMVGTEGMVGEQVVGTVDEQTVGTESEQVMGMVGTVGEQVMGMVGMVGKQLVGTEGTEGERVVGTVGKQPVGTVAMVGTEGMVGEQPVGTGELVLKRMAVRKDYRGLGIATALARTALAFARHRGARAVVLNTLMVQREAQALYEHLGFRRHRRYVLPTLYGRLANCTITVYRYDLPGAP